MSTDNQPTTPANLAQQLSELLLATLTSNWQAIVARLWGLWRSLCGKRADRDLYEILDYDLVLDLKDNEGRLAIFRRRQKVRFLQDHVIAYQDEAWGDGDVVAGYKCTPGVPVDFFRIGPRRLMLISLRQTKNRDDVMEFNIERKVKNGFTGQEEWLEVETRYPTRRLRISVLFPKGRPCQRARLVERRADRTTNLGAEHFGQTGDGRQVVAWETTKPVQHESYTISWTW
jgi:hypothetical protein